jgi:hypothetical protein
MKRLTTRLLPALVVACVLVAPAAGELPTLLFDYVGFDYEDPDNDPVFGAVGDGYKGVGEVPVINVVPSNQTTNQYTYFFDGLTASSRQEFAPFVIIDYTGPGTLTIYEDSRSTGTPADYGTNPPSLVGGAPPTFVDGTAILVGELTNFRYLFNTDTNSGSFDAIFKAVGGSEIASIPENQRDGWNFSGTTGHSQTIPTGYDHQVDGQTFLHPPTSARPGTWGGIKARYRGAR